METEPSSFIERVQGKALPELPNQDRFLHWVFETVQPYLTTPILEISSGRGFLATHFAEKGIRMHLSDSEKPNRDYLRAILGEVDKIRHVHNIDFHNPDFSTSYSEVLGQFGTVMALNVLDNGPFSRESIRNTRHVLRLRGRLILMTPAFTSMVFGLEDNLQDWKKYNREALKRLLGKGLELIAVHYLNLGFATSMRPNEPLGLSALVVARRLE